MTSLCSYAKHLPAQYVNMIVSQVILSGITLGPRVDQSVETVIALADSTMMMQLCCHNWEVKTFSSAQNYWSHLLYLI